MRSMLARLCTTIYLALLLGIASLATILCLARFAQTAEQARPEAPPVAVITESGISSLPAMLTSTLPSTPSR